MTIKYSETSPVSSTTELYCVHSTVYTVSYSKQMNNHQESMKVPVREMCDFINYRNLLIVQGQLNLLVIQLRVQILVLSMQLREQFLRPGCEFQPGVEIR